MSQLPTRTKSVQDISLQTSDESSSNLGLSTAKQVKVQPRSNFKEVNDCGVSITPDVGLGVLGIVSPNVVGELSVTSATKNRPSSVDTGSKQQRRLQRYSTAEESLAKLFRQCQAELSPRELQIRMLEQATVILDAYTQDARERAEKLRSVLTDRDIDPENYENIKKDLWLQEHRRCLVDYERKAVLQHLEVLTKTHDRDALPREGCDNTREIRRYQNLLRFLNTSHVSSPVRFRKSTLLVERPVKRRTIERSSPMRCRTASTSRTLFQLRPLSLDSRPRRLTRPQLGSKYSDATMQSANISSHLSIMRRDSLTTDTSQSSHPSPSSLSTEPLTPTSPNMPMAVPQPPFINTNPAFSGPMGTAIIYLNPIPTPSYDTQLNAHDVEASLPDYALDLLSSLDCKLPTSLTNIQYLHDLPAYASDFISHKAPSQSDVGGRHRTSPPLEVPVRTPQRHLDPESSPQRTSQHRRLGLPFLMPEALSSRARVESGHQRTRKDALLSNSTFPLTLPTQEEAKPKMKKRFSLLRLGRF